MWKFICWFLGHKKRPIIEKNSVIGNLQKAYPEIEFDFMKKCTRCGKVF